MFRASLRLGQKMFVILSGVNYFVRHILALASAAAGPRRIEQSQCVSSLSIYQVPAVWGSQRTLSFSSQEEHTRTRGAHLWEAHTRQRTTDNICDITGTSRTCQSASASNHGEKEKKKKTGTFAKSLPQQLRPDDYVPILLQAFAPPRD